MSSRINKKRIETDQKAFFNSNAHEIKNIDLDSYFSKYANKEQVDGFRWIADKKNILEYGCGTGISLDIFFKRRERKKYNIFGVDIALEAIKKARKNYPEYTFYKISNNKIPRIKNDSLDAVFMLHVLHHADKHEDIFREIHAKLKRGGKFLINDLSSNNPINKSARNMFIYMPRFIKNKFSDDLVVGESIPEKYKVYPEKVVKQLQDAGFEMDEIGYGHLFFFVFGWVDRFIPMSKFLFIRNVYAKCMRFEQYLLQKEYFKKHAEVFYIQCIKK